MNIDQFSGVDAARFRDEILPRGKPAVLRGAVRHWPVVQASLQSPMGLCDYLRRFDNGHLAKTLVGDASIRGKFFYRDDLRGLNFTANGEPLNKALDRLRTHFDDATPPAIAVQSVVVSECLPGFEKENVLGLLGNEVPPRIWIGNATTVVAHSDPMENLACVIAGHRRFTLFPPEQMPNLYLGPFEFTPAGTPVSMVDLDAPDFARYPRFERALAAAQVAELEPGDALYIPYFWWHHVQSLDRLNALVNYWWNAAPAELGSPLDAFLHALASLRPLPPDQLAVWQMMFEYYVFQTSGEPAGHLPPGERGVLGSSITRGHRAQIKEHLLRALNRW